MKFDDFLKYLTIQLMNHIEQPKRYKNDEKGQKKSYSNHWFGMIPFSIKMVTKRFQKNA